MVPVEPVVPETAPKRSKPGNFVFSFDLLPCSVPPCFCYLIMANELSERRTVTLAWLTTSLCKEKLGCEDV